MRRSPLLVLTTVELRLFFRNPRAAFFILGFPLMLLLVFGGIFGNKPITGQPGGAMDLTLPNYFGMIIGTAGLMGVPGWISTYREQGVFRRFRVTPAEPWMVLLAQGTVGAITAFMGTLLLFAVGRLWLHLRFPAAPLQMVAGFLVAYATLFSLGAMIAAVARTARTAQAVGMMLYFPMLFLSGAAFPRAMMPPGVQRISGLLPLTHANILLSGLWLEGAWKLPALAVCGGVIVVAGTIAARNFRWE